MKDINPVQAQMNIAVVALVALVAIIGLVALVLNAPVLGKEVVPSVEQAAQIDNSAGDAYYRGSDGFIYGHDIPIIRKPFNNYSENYSRNYSRNYSGK